MTSSEICLHFTWNLLQFEQKCNNSQGIGWKRNSRLECQESINPKRVTDSYIENLYTMQKLTSRMNATEYEQHQIEQRSVTSAKKFLLAD